MFDGETQAVNDVLGVFCASEHHNLALHQVLQRIEMTCEEIGFPVEVERFYCQMRGLRSRNLLIQKAIFICARKRTTKDAEIRRCF